MSVKHKEQQLITTPSSHHSVKNAAFCWGHQLYLLIKKKKSFILKVAINFHPRIRHLSVGFHLVLGLADEMCA